MATRRLELGFEGGSVLRLSVDEAAVPAARSALCDGEGRWLEITADEGEFSVDRERVLYLRIPPGEVAGRVGFGDS